MSLSEIRNQKSEIRNQKSEIRNQNEGLALVQDIKAVFSTYLSTRSSEDFEASRSDLYYDEIARSFVDSPDADILTVLSNLDLRASVQQRLTNQKSINPSDEGSYIILSAAVGLSIKNLAVEDSDKQLSSEELNYVLFEKNESALNLVDPDSSSSGSSSPSSSSSSGSMQPGESTTKPESKQITSLIERLTDKTSGLTTDAIKATTVAQVWLSNFSVPEHVKTYAVPCIVVACALVAAKPLYASATQWVHQNTGWDLKISAQGIKNSIQQSLQELELISIDKFYKEDAIEWSKKLANLPGWVFSPTDKYQVRAESRELYAKFSQKIIKNPNLSLDDHILIFQNIFPTARQDSGVSDQFKKIRESMTLEHFKNATPNSLKYFIKTIPLPEIKKLYPNFSASQIIYIESLISDFGSEITGNATSLSKTFNKEHSKWLSEVKTVKGDLDMEKVQKLKITNSLSSIPQIKQESIQASITKSVVTKNINPPAIPIKKARLRLFDETSFPENQEFARQVMFTEDLPVVGLRLSKYLSGS